MNNYQPPFTLTIEMINLLSSIMEQIGGLKIYSDLNSFPKLRKQNRIKSIYSSCAIESGLLIYEYPDKPTTKLQRYIKIK